WQLFLPQLLRGFGMMFAIVPITNISLGTLPPEWLKNASGLFNLTRNLGGAVGFLAMTRSRTSDVSKERRPDAGPAFAVSNTVTRCRRLVRGGKCDALAHLHDGPVDEFDRALAVAALVGDGSFQFRARILQEGKRGIHAGLRPQGIANSEI